MCSRARCPAVSQDDLWTEDDLSAKLLLGPWDNWKSSEADFRSVCEPQGLEFYSQMKADLHLNAATKWEHLISLEIKNTSAAGDRELPAAVTQVMDFC